MRQAERRTKKKHERPNYKTMDTPSYVLVRSQDWYTEGDRDYELDDNSFWCAEQEAIYKDIYEKAKKPIRPMSATNLTHISTHPEFSEVYGVLEQLGLLHLMTIQCNYSTQLILQFYSTLVMCGDDAMTIKWMSGTEYCESTWTKFAEILGYDILAQLPMTRTSWLIKRMLMG